MIPSRNMQTKLNSRYVLVSACRNEESYIEGLINCIAAQTLQPVRWVIVDDGSTDDTYTRAMVSSSALHFIQTVKMSAGHPRSFTSQVFAAQHGFEITKGLPFEYIGFLDADIRVDSDYYERLIHFFQTNSRLGLIGGSVIDKYDDRTENIRQGSEHFHVAGAVQFFRRECFEQIGGYIPIEGGGQDTIADVMAMMHGWQVQAFPEIKALHLRPGGFTNDSTFAQGIKWGRKFYLLGYHPLFYLGQCVRRLTRHPIIIGSCCNFLGFAAASLSRESRPVTREFVRYLRRIQMRRFRQTLMCERLSYAAQESNH